MSEKLFIEAAAIRMKKMIRESALENWKLVCALQENVKGLTDIYKDITSEGDIKPMMELQEGLAKYRLTMDEVIKDFS